MRYSTSGQVSLALKVNSSMPGPGHPKIIGPFHCRCTRERVIDAARRRCAVGRESGFPAVFLCHRCLRLCRLSVCAEGGRHDACPKGFLTRLAQLLLSWSYSQSG